MSSQMFMMGIVFLGFFSVFLLILENVFGNGQSLHSIINQNLKYLLCNQDNSIGTLGGVCKFYQNC